MAFRCTLAKTLLTTKLRSSFKLVLQE